MRRLASIWAQGWARRWALVGALGVAFAFAGCDLNPQPEVPSGATGGGAGSGGKAGGGGAGGASGGGGGINLGGAAGAGGASSGGAGGTTSMRGGGGAGGVRCDGGTCVDDPRAPNSCKSDQACKPSADFTASNCVESCAEVVCGANEACENGTCKPTGCASACKGGEICAPSGDGGFACVPDLCAGDAPVSCGVGESCAPATGACAPDPCNGVKCPAQQACQSGECRRAGDGGSGDSGPTDASAD